jgi:5-methylcytosine-specific restriction endonuclease McrA
MEEEKCLAKSFDYRCAYCGRRKKLGLDHVAPLSRATVLGIMGRHVLGNVVPCCGNCNASKNDNPDWLLWYKGKSFYSPVRARKIFKTVGVFWRNGK